MKKTEVVLLVLLLAVVGCSKPAPVELLPPDTDGLLEVSAVVPGDTSFAFAPIDSGAILPVDRDRFAGLLHIVHLTFDGGQRVVDTAFARALLENRNRPVRVLGRIVGYQGMNLGLVRVNTFPLLPILHRVGRRDSVAGLEYIRDMTSQYQPRTTYTWTATPDSMNPITTTIETPGDLVVHSPAGGTVIRRDRDLPLSWTGEGNLFFVISAYDPVNKKTRPLLNVRVKNNIQHAVLGRKFLQLLPPQHLYVFTFLLTNRKEIDVAGFQGHILVQATAVYNSYVDLR